jgi:hypothetical protein
MISAAQYKSLPNNTAAMESWHFMKFTYSGPVKLNSSK